MEKLFHGFLPLYENSDPACQNYHENEVEHYIIKLYRKSKYLKGIVKVNPYKTLMYARKWKFQG